MEKRKSVRIRLVILLTFISMIFVGNVMLVGANPGKLVHNAWNPPGVMLGITKDDISLKNEVKLCIPTPTDNVNNGVKWSFCNTDFSYSLQQFDKNSAQYFPLNDLPSGGNSGRISASEMVIAVVSILNKDPGDGYVQFSWYENKTNGEDDRLMVKSKEVIVPACGGYPPINNECAIYKSYVTYGYIGHFSGEIVEGGYYYVVIDTKWGQSKIDFGVVPIVNGGSGDGKYTVVTPVPKVKSTSVPI